MIKFSIARVTLFVMACLVCVTEVSAWGFGGDSDAPRDSGRRGRRGEDERGGYDNVETRDEARDMPDPILTDKRDKRPFDKKKGSSKRPSKE